MNNNKEICEVQLVFCILFWFLDFLTLITYQLVRLRSPCFGIPDEPPGYVRQWLVCCLVASSLSLGVLYVLNNISTALQNCPPSGSLIPKQVT